MRGEIYSRWGVRPNTPEARAGCEGMTHAMQQRSATQSCSLVHEGSCGALALLPDDARTPVWRIHLAETS